MDCNCAICLHNDKQIKNKLKCNHTFHKKCINKYFNNLIQNNKNLICPLCRNIELIHPIQLYKKQIKEITEYIKIQKNIYIIMINNLNIIDENKKFNLFLKYIIYFLQKKFNNKVFNISNILYDIHITFNTNITIRSPWDNF